MKTIVVSIAAGIFISLALFWLMQYMISNNQQGFEKTENLQMTEFIRLKKEQRLDIKKRPIPEQPPPEKRPPPPAKMKMQNVHVKKHNLTAMDMPKLDIPLQADAFSRSVMSGAQMEKGVVEGVAMGVGEISTNVIPLVRIPPRYPMRAAKRRIEGWVKIEFTITTEGKVKDASVVSAKPSSIFNRAALKAIKRWKFKAKIIDGKAYEQRALQVLQFKLSK